MADRSRVVAASLGAGALALAGCSSAASDQPDTVATTVTATVTATPSADDAFWSELTAQVSIPDSYRPGLIDSAHEICAALDVDDPLMDGAVAYWAGWSDGETDPTPIWQAAIDSYCPDRASAWQTVRELKDALNP